MSSDHSVLLIPIRQIVLPSNIMYSTDHYVLLTETIMSSRYQSVLSSPTTLPYFYLTDIRQDLAALLDIGILVQEKIGERVVRVEAVARPHGVLLVTQGDARLVRVRVDNLWKMHIHV